jgi:cytochrome P450
MYLYILTFGALLAWITFYICLIPRPIPGVPYNRLSAWMPWGDLAALGVFNIRTGEVFSWLSLQCVHLRSPIVQLFIPSFSCTRPTLVIADLREIEDIATKRMHEIDRAPLMHTFFGLLVPRATIGMPSGHAFRQQRRLWNSILSPTFLKNVAAPKFHETVLQLGDLWQQKIDQAEGCAFEAVEDIQLATLDAIWKMAVGFGIGLLDAVEESLDTKPSKRSKGKITFPRPSFPVFYRALRTLLICLDWVTQGVSPRVYTWIFRHTPFLPRAEHVKNEILQSIIAAERVRYVREEKTIVQCALDQVFSTDAMRAPGSSEKATSDEHLCDELLELLITGHETTASSISWALKYLTDNPDIQDRLRKSLKTVFPTASASNPPLASDLMTASLPYLDAVITEVLRCSNTGPVSFRQTIQDCNILGHYIPSETPIILVTAGPSYNHSNKAIIPEHSRSLSSQATFLKKGAREFSSSFDANQFIPERWLIDGEFNPDAGHSLPFSTGPRGCFGKKVALLEMRLMISLLILRFEFPRLPENMSKYTAKDGLTRRPDCCYVRPVGQKVDS